MAKLRLVCRDHNAMFTDEWKSGKPLLECFGCGCAFAPDSHEEQEKMNGQPCPECGKPLKG